MDPYDPYDPSQQSPFEEFHKKGMFASQRKREETGLRTKVDQLFSVTVNTF